MACLQEPERGGIDRAIDSLCKLVWWIFIPIPRKMACVTALADLMWPNSSPIMLGRLLWLIPVVAAVLNVGNPGNVFMPSSCSLLGVVVLGRGSDPASFWTSEESNSVVDLKTREGLQKASTIRQLIRAFSQSVSYALNRHPIHTLMIEPLAKLQYFIFHLLPQWFT